MSMRLTFIATSAISLLLPALVLCGCSTTAPIPPRPAIINHFVEFKLADPNDAEELIADCDRYLAHIPGVVSYFAGRHHDTGRGERVYSDYDVGFFVGFNSDEDYEAYVVHPDHVEVVNKWRPRLVRLRVYDVWDDGMRNKKKARSR